MDNITQFTHIGRPLDPRYPTNLAIMILAGLATVAILIFRLIGGIELVQAGISAFLAGMSVFIVWGLSREIDPDHDFSAFVSAIIMIAVLFLMDGQFNLLVLFYLLSMARLLNRTTGLSAKFSDSLALFGFTIFVSFVDSWIFAMMGGTMFLLDSILPTRNRQGLLFAGASVVVMVIAFFVQGGGLNPILPTLEYITGVVATTLLFIPIIMRSNQITSTGDFTGEPLVPLRIQAIQVVALLSGYHVAVWQGNAGIIAFLPLWVTFLGIAVFPAIERFLPDWNLSRRSKE